MNGNGNFLFFTKLDELGDSDSKWIEVLKTGTFDQGDGAFEITIDDLHNAVGAANKHFFDHGQSVPVFIGHKVMFSQWARTEEELSGSGDKMKVEGERLLAHVNFVKDMAQKIREKKFRGASAEFTTNLMSESGEELGFGLTAIGMTNVPFLGLQPISLSVVTAQEKTMPYTQSENRLMALTGEQSPEAALVKWEGMTTELRTLTAENKELKDRNAKQVRDLAEAKNFSANVEAKGLINKAIGENRPVAGMVEGFDAEPTAENQYPALHALSQFGGVEGASFVFAKIAPLQKTTKGLSHGTPSGDVEVGETGDEIDGIPQKALTVAQARVHFCEKNEIDMEAYNRQRRYFSQTSEADFLKNESYILVSEDKTGS